MDEDIDENGKTATQQATSRVIERLRKKYKEEFFIEEFRNAPSGFTHRIDGVAITLHPSRGKFIECFEVKALRSDWLKELRTPSKADTIAQHCHKIWLVTTDETVARLQEIPDTWGWMVLKGNRFEVKKVAPVQDPTFDTDFVITLAQYCKQEYNSAIYDAQRRAYDEAKVVAESRYDKEYWKQESERNAKKIKDMEEKFEALNKVLNLEYMFEDFDSKEEIVKKGQLLQAILNLNYTLTHSQGIDWFESNLKQLETGVGEVRKAVKALKKTEIDLQPPEAAP